MMGRVAIVVDEMADTGFSRLQRHLERTILERLAKNQVDAVTQPLQCDAALGIERSGLQFAVDLEHARNHAPERAISQPVVVDVGAHAKTSETRQVVELGLAVGCRPAP